MEEQGQLMAGSGCVLFGAVPHVLGCPLQPGTPRGQDVALRSACHKEIILIPLCALCEAAKFPILPTEHLNGLFCCTVGKRGLQARLVQQEGSTVLTHHLGAAGPS